MTLLALQSLYFVLFLQRPFHVELDNAFYETSGYNLSRGRGLSLPYSLLPDEIVRGWACNRHPDACREGLVPTAVFPPGYSVFIAAIYAFTGRSLAAIFVVQYGLLLALFCLLEAMAARLLNAAGYWFCVVIAAVYPFFARQANWIMSDHLHAFLLVAALATGLLAQPGRARGALFGFLLAAATLVRPYSMLVIPATLAGRGIWTSCGVRERFWAVAACAAPLLVWIARNAYVFGRFIPFCTGGVANGFFYLMLEGTVGDPYDPQRAERLWRAPREYGTDFYTFALDRRLGQEGWAWTLAHPFRSLALIVAHVPKVWVSLGWSNSRLGPLAIALGLFLGSLFLLGLLGAWLGRSAPAWRLLIVSIAAYWPMVIMQSEARRTLPLRIPMLLLAGLAVERLAAARAGGSAAQA